MRRRHVIALIAGFGLVGTPLDAGFASKRIGVLAQDLQPGLLEAFRAGLHDLGYDEGRNLTIEVRDAEGRADRLPEMVADLIRLNVGVILAVNTPAARAAAKATTTIPIIIMRVADPVKAGLIANLARPGGNVTGLYFMPDILGAKSIELLREALPKISRVGALYSADNSGGLLVVEETERRCAQLGLQFQRLPVRDADEDSKAIEAAVQQRIEALFVMDDGAVTKRRQHIVDLAGRQKIPVVSIYRDFAEAGALFSYGPSLTELYRRGAYFADRLLKGESASLLPVEQPTKFDLFVNMRTAKALGIEIPPSVLLRANEVIE